MLYYVVLYCIILLVLYYIILSCIILYCIVLYYIVLYYIVLYYIIFFYFQYIQVWTIRPLRTEKLIQWCLDFPPKNPKRRLRCCTSVSSCRSICRPKWFVASTAVAESLGFPARSQVGQKSWGADSRHIGSYIYICHIIPAINEFWTLSYICHRISSYFIPVFMIWRGFKGDINITYILIHNIGPPS